jgi:DNA invertase Pin-like site-specific DNA recombinase
MVIGYARVSTDDQTNAAQLAELKKAGCKRIYEEKISGRNVDRPELTRCLDRLDKATPSLCGVSIAWEGR